MSVNSFLDLSQRVTPSDSITCTIRFPGSVNEDFFPVITDNLHGSFYAAIFSITSDDNANFEDIDINHTLRTAIIQAYAKYLNDAGTLSKKDPLPIVIINGDSVKVWEHQVFKGYFVSTSPSAFGNFVVNVDEWISSMDGFIYQAMIHDAPSIRLKVSAMPEYLGMSSFEWKRISSSHMTNELYNGIERAVDQYHKRYHQYIPQPIHSSVNVGLRESIFHIRQIANPVLAQWSTVLDCSPNNTIIPTVFAYTKYCKNLISPHTIQSIADPRNPSAVLLKNTLKIMGDVIHAMRENGNLIPGDKIALMAGIDPAAIETSELIARFLLFRIEKDKQHYTYYEISCTKEQYTSFYRESNIVDVFN